MEKKCECGCGKPAPLAKRNEKTKGWIKGQPVRFILHHHVYSVDRKAKRSPISREQRIALIQSGKNVCGTCNRTKSLKHFSTCIEGPYGYRTTCKLCRNRKEREPQRLRARRSATPARHYSACKASAKARHLPWEISKEFFYENLKKVCHYCEDCLPKYGVGMDRLNNTEGYTEYNVVPCCAICNWVRANRFTVQEMERIGALLKTLRSERKINEINSGASGTNGAVSG